MFHSSNRHPIQNSTFSCVLPAYDVAIQLKATDAYAHAGTKRVPASRGRRRDTGDASLLSQYFSPQVFLFSDLCLESAMVLFLELQTTAQQLLVAKSFL